MLDCIDNTVTFSQEMPAIYAKVVDGAVVIHMLKPGFPKTFSDYAHIVFILYILSQL